MSPCLISSAWCVCVRRLILSHQCQSCHLIALLSCSGYAMMLSCLLCHRRCGGICSHRRCVVLSLSHRWCGGMPYHDVVLFALSHRQCGAVLCYDVVLSSCLLVGGAVGGYAFSLSLSHRWCGGMPCHDVVLSVMSYPTSGAMLPHYTISYHIVTMR